MKKIYISLLIGIIGFYLVLYNFLYYYEGPPSAHPVSLHKLIVKSIEDILVERTPQWISDFFYYVLGFGFIIVFFVSPLGIFIGVKFYRFSERKLVLVAILLNVFNFFFSLFIAWLLFGLARGM